MKSKYYLVALLILVVDRATKWLARVRLGPSRTIELVPGYLRLSYVHNSGVAFGFFDKIESTWKPYILAAMAIAAIVVIVVYGVRMPRGRRLLQSALAITLGGILGNFADRILRGYVVDFIEFHIREAFYWPTFNVADSAITIGIALLLIDTVKGPALGEIPAPPTVHSRS